MLQRFLFGLLIAAIALPPLLVLPLRWVNPPTTAFMLRTHWQANAKIHHQWIDLVAISPALALAVVASEDQTFPTHNGFAWQSIGNAVEDRLNGQPLRGASTISQQTVKNLFLWPAHSWLRKGIEAYFTVWLEILLSKRRILELYLNIAQFGPTTFGAQSASERFFGIPPARLSWSRAALLAAVLPAPTEYDATAPSAYIRNRQAWIIGQMQTLGPGYLRPTLAASR